MIANWFSMTFYMLNKPTQKNTVLFYKLPCNVQKNEQQLISFWTFIYFKCRLIFLFFGCKHTLLKVKMDGIYYFFFVNNYFSRRKGHWKLTNSWMIWQLSGHRALKPNDRFHLITRNILPYILKRRFEHQVWFRIHLKIPSFV